MTANLEGAVIDDAYQISDDEASRSFSTCSNMRGFAWRFDRHQHRRRHSLGQRNGTGPHHRDVLCDYGTRYQSKLFNPDFMRSKNLPVPDWLEQRSTINVPFEKV